MKLISAANPVFANTDNSQINLDVQFDTFPNPIPFTACPNDAEAHGREIYASAIAGEFGVVGVYVPPPAPTTPANKPQPITTGATVL
jgi:hypothetical protein